MDLPARLRCQYSCLQPAVWGSGSARKRTRVKQSRVVGQNIFNIVFNVDADKI